MCCAGRRGAAVKLPGGSGMCCQLLVRGGNLWGWISGPYWPGHTGLAMRSSRKNCFRKTGLALQDGWQGILGIDPVHLLVSCIYKAASIGDSMGRQRRALGRFAIDMRAAVDDDLVMPPDDLMLVMNMTSHTNKQHLETKTCAHQGCRSHVPWSL